MISKKISIAVLLLGILLLGIVLMELDFSMLSKDRISLDVVSVSLIVFGILGYFFTRSLRWWLLLRWSSIHISFRRAFLLNSGALAFSLYSPSNIGEAIKLEQLKSDIDVKRRNSLPTFIYERAIDLAFVSFLFLVFVLKSGNTMGLQIHVVLLGLSALAIVGLVVVYFAFKKSSFVKEVLQSLAKMSISPEILLVSSILSLISWAFVCLIWTTVAKVVSVEVPYLAMMLVIGASAITTLISLIPGAIGSLEFSVVIFLGILLGMPHSEGALFAIALRLETILMFLSGYLCYFLYTREHQ